MFEQLEIGDKGVDIFPLVSSLKKCPKNSYDLFCYYREPGYGP